MAVIGEIAVLLSAKTAQFMRGLQRASKATGSFNKRIGGSITRSMRSFASGMLRMTGAAVGLAGAVGVASIAIKSFHVATDLENMEAVFTTFLKSGEKAKAFMSELKKFSDVTPFTGKAVQEAGKQLVAFGFDTRETIKWLKILGNFSAGSGRNIGEFIDIVGKMKASGVVALGDYNRLADRGVVLTAALANKFGIAESEVRSFISTGKLGFEDMAKLLVGMGEGTGTFAGAMDRLSKTTTGKLSTMQSKFEDVMAVIGTGMIEAFDVNNFADQLANMAELYKTDIVEATVIGVEAIKKAIIALSNTVRFLSDAKTVSDVVVATLTSTSAEERNSKILEILQSQVAKQEARDQAKADAHNKRVQEAQLAEQKKTNELISVSQTVIGTF